MVRPRHTNSRGRPGSPIAMREVSAVSVMGLMGSLMKRSGMVGILHHGNPHAEKIEIEPEWHIILRLWDPTSTNSFLTAFSNKGSTPKKLLPCFVTCPKSWSQALELTRRRQWCNAGLPIFSTGTGVAGIGKPRVDPRQLTPFIIRPTFSIDCRDGFRCRESTTIRFRHHDRLVIRGGQFSLLLLAASSGYFDLTIRKPTKLYRLFFHSISPRLADLHC